MGNYDCAADPGGWDLLGASARVVLGSGDDCGAVRAVWVAGLAGVWAGGEGVSASWIWERAWSICAMASS